MKTLLVVDDHPIVLEGIESVLSRQGYKILKATSASEAMTIAGHVEGIDMFVIDLSLSDNTDGLTLAETLREKGIDRPVVIYTMHEELWNISLLM
ncbi:MAG: response regulator, partial [Duncaniella dubosii]|nr:response regulator [Duncaniella dubosii]